MAKTAKKKKANGGRKKKSHQNGMFMKKRRRSNPTGVGAIIGSPKDLAVMGAAGLASAVATRQLPQAFLSASNTGIEGYAANAVVTAIMTVLSGMVGGPKAGVGALIGGTVIILDRILSDNVSPIASYLSLSGVGDPQAYSKLGTIRKGFFTHPNLQNADGSMYVPDPFMDASVQAVVAKFPQLAAPIAQAAGAGRMGAVQPSSLRRHAVGPMMLSSRFASRFNQAG